MHAVNHKKTPCEINYGDKTPLHAITRKTEIFESTPLPVRARGSPEGFPRKRNHAVKKEATIVILTKEELVKSITDFVGTDTSEKALEFVTNAFDTIGSLDSDKSDEIQRLQRELEATNESWRKKYMERFYSGIAGTADSQSDAVDVQEKAEEITVNDLFE